MSDLVLAIIIITVILVVAAIIILGVVFSKNDKKVKPQPQTIIVEQKVDEPAKPEKSPAKKKVKCNSCGANYITDENEATLCPYCNT